MLENLFRGILSVLADAPQYNEFFARGLAYLGAGIAVLTGMDRRLGSARRENNRSRKRRRIVARRIAGKRVGDRERPGRTTRRARKDNVLSSSLRLAEIWRHSHRNDSCNEVRRRRPVGGNRVIVDIERAHIRLPRRKVVKHL